MTPTAQVGAVLAELQLYQLQFTYDEHLLERVLGSLLIPVAEPAEDSSSTPI